MLSIKNVAALSLFAVATALFAAPQYRLVSGERGVMLSIDKVKKEPAVQVELIDGNLSVTVPGTGLEGTSTNSYRLGKEFWADSIVASRNNGVAKILFYGFRLSKDDLQKKFTGERLMLLLSPLKSAAYDKVLFAETASSNAAVSAPKSAGVSDTASKAKVSGVSIVNRDGLEFVTLTGTTLGKPAIEPNEKGVALRFATPLASGSVKQKIDAAYLVDSVKVAKDGALQLYFKSKNGHYSFAKFNDTKAVLTFKDSRENDLPQVMAFDSAKKYKFTVTQSPVTTVAKQDAGKPIVVYLTKDNVNIRRSPSSKDASNIIGKFAIGTKFVAESKENGWFKIRLESGEIGWVGTSMAADSASVTVAQWDAIQNASGTSKAKPVVDEFNSPGKDPLLTDKQKGGFKLDSAVSSKGGAKAVKTPTADSAKQVVQIKPYEKKGRDPFLPLNTTDFIRPKMPKVDKLTLVGVIYDPRDGIALFDEVVDGKTVSFSMRVGEAVENGKLLKIYERKVVFLMKEADFTYTIEKELLVKKE